MKNIIIIISLGGCGKSTLAYNLSKKLNAGVIMSDEYRCYPNTWIRLPTEDYLRNVSQVINNLPQETVVFETCCQFNDPKDPNKTLNQMIDLLMPYTSQVIVIKPPSLVERTANLIDRCIRRETGEERQGAAKETSIGRATMVVASIKYFEEHCQTLDNYVKTIPSDKLIYLPINEIYQKLGLEFQRLT